MFNRNCPNPKHNLRCINIINYKDKRDRNRAEKRKSLCISCAHLDIPQSDYSRKLKSIKNIERYKNINERIKTGNASRKYDCISKITSKRQRRYFHKWLDGKVNGFEKYIGLSLNEFKIWIAFQFKEHMSWENYAFHTWHIDHIKPLCSFKLSEKIQTLEAWNYKNLRPLHAKDNMKKHTKIFYSI